MSPRRVRAEADAVERRERPLRITVDGEPVDGIAGQTIAGVLLAADRVAWRRARSGAPRGVFCGIGVCFDCLVTVGDERDVRACRRRAREGDAVRTQSREAGVGHSGVRDGAGAAPEPAADVVGPMPDVAEATPGAAGTTPGAAEATPGAAGTTPGAAEAMPGAAGTTPDAPAPESAAGAVGPMPGVVGSTPDAAGSASTAPEPVPGTAGAAPDVVGPAPRSDGPPTSGPETEGR